VSRNGTSANVALQNTLRVSEKDKQKLFEADLKSVAATPSGQRVLGWLIYSVCKLEQRSFDTHGSLSAFQEGRRSVGASMLEQLRAFDKGLDLAIYTRRHEERVNDELAAISAELNTRKREDTDA
jgi:hypothetical protein